MCSSSNIIMAKKKEEEDDDDDGPLRIYFIPLMSPGHMIPMIDIAKLFASRGPAFVSATIITTPANEALVRPSISSFPNIHLILLPFPPSVAHLLPNGQENLASFSYSSFQLFFNAFYALQQPLDDLLHAHRPDCIVSDSMFTWTTATAFSLNIPRIVFFGHGIFTSCVHESLELHFPYEKVSDDKEVFVVEGLPHRIEMTRPQVSPGIIYQPPGKRESVQNCFGVIVNSFFELEPEYAELYRQSTRRAYYIGPVSLSNKNNKEAAAARGESRANISELIDKWTTWLDSKEKGSVVYVCFGSLNEFSGDQLREVALGLEELNRPFVWVVSSKTTEADMNGLDVLLEEKVLKGKGKGKGMVIRGWAPQMMMLSHPAVGAFVTHCGWNSILEGISAGVVMVTCPVEYEQFVNEKLVAEVLNIGVKVENNVGKRGIVKGEEIAKAVERVMGEGEEVEIRRVRAREYAEKAKTAMKDGGSSFVDLSRLIDEIKDEKIQRDM